MWGMVSVIDKRAKDLLLIERGVGVIADSKWTRSDDGLL
jgi:hypothetical protein